MRVFGDGNRRKFEFCEDSLSSMRWESEPFEINGDFSPCDISINCWTVPDADGSTSCFIDCNSFEHRHRPLKINVADHGCKVVADKVCRAVRENMRNDPTEVFFENICGCCNNYVARPYMIHIGRNEKDEVCNHIRCPCKSGGAREGACGCETLRCGQGGLRRRRGGVWPRPGGRVARDMCVRALRIRS